ncbi:conserved protein of unknown function [Tenacibaculum sp. 190524A02b]|uniref:hypothetical protein n=1 Tax=Tenacibaculum vairaonense TaxID=3137860 RepID=UPI0032B18A56
MAKIITLIFFFNSLIVLSQFDSGNLMGVPVVPNLTDATGITGANNGNMVYVDAEKSMYIYDGANWVKILNNAPVITNELLFEDNDYIYVSVRINTNDWMVSRYHKSDINTETLAMGTGTQPTTLVAVAALTYN